MGEKTAAEIISEGMNLAGRDDLATPALTWLNNWLRSQYAAWPWPFLYKRAIDVPMNAGAQTLRIGGGTLETLAIRRIMDPVRIRTADYSVQQIARIRQMVDPRQEPWIDEAMTNPASRNGIPELFKVRAKPVDGTTPTLPTQTGVWDLIPDFIPDRNLLITIEYMVMPGNLVAANYPLYPEDQTMVQHIYARTLRYTAGQDPEQIANADKQDGITGEMAVADRLKYGMQDGTNDRLDLDQSIFR